MHEIYEMNILRSQFARHLPAVSIGPLSSSSSLPARLDIVYAPEMLTQINTEAKDRPFRKEIKGTAIENHLKSIKIH